MSVDVECRVASDIKVVGGPQRGIRTQRQGTGRNEGCPSKAIVAVADGDIAAVKRNAAGTHHKSRQISVIRLR